MNSEALPWSEQAEQSVLGALMIDSAALPLVQQRGLQASHFFAGAHGPIWRAVSELAALHQPADVVSVFEHLQSRGLLEQCGGIEYLQSLSQCVLSATNVGRHADIVLEKALCRSLMAAADAIQAIAVEPGSADEKLDRAATLLAGLKRTKARSAPRQLSAVMTDRLSHWQALATGEITAGMPTHLPTLDSALGGGLRPGAVLIIAARPSFGKTSFAGQVALTCAGDGHPVLVLSQEMTAGELADRAAANLGRLNLSALTTGRFADADWSRITDASETAMQLPLYVDDDPALNLLDIRAKARQVPGLKVLIVDYLQLCSGGNNRDNRNTQIEEISRGLKALAKECQVAVIALSQLSRGSVQRSEPDLADLRDSGAIEQDADAVMFLHPKGNLPDGSLLIAGILAKNRQGRRGRVALAFHAPTQRWVESTADVSPNKL